MMPNLHLWYFIEKLLIEQQLLKENLLNLYHEKCDEEFSHPNNVVLSLIERIVII